MLLDTPVEVICHVLSFLSPHEIVRLRWTYDPTIWKTVYANAPLPRPSGPFPYQSTQFLEHTLIQSEWLAQTWTSQPVKAIFHVLAPKRSRSNLPHWSVLGGKWFIWHETTKVLCHDLDGGTSSRHILWDRDAQIDHLDACLITAVGGQRVYTVVGTWFGRYEQPILKLLEFEVDDNSCSFSGPVSIDIPLLPREFPPSVSGQWPFVCIREPALVLVWDMRTRIFHKLPSLSSGLPRITSLSSQPEILLSKTHVIAIYRPRWRGGGWLAGTLLQAFVVPDPLPHSDGEAIHELRLTHEAPLEHESFSFSLLHNSVFDPVTRSTNLRILTHSQYNGDGMKYTCIDLTLSEPSPGNVLPMSVHCQHLFTGRKGFYSWTASSDDGHLRGVFPEVDFEEYFVRKQNKQDSLEKQTGIEAEASGWSDLSQEGETNELSLSPGHISQSRVAYDAMKIIIESNTIAIADHVCPSPNPSLPFIRQGDEPVEVICHILSFLSLREIVRLRRTSKQFRDITYDPAIWKTVYANTPLLRPSGPFPYQSAQFLEHTLVQSAKLAQTWASHPVKAISRVVGPKTSWDILQWSVLGGKWFIWHETTQILCHDLDSGTDSRHILWDGDAQIVHFDACLIDSVDGQRVYILVVTTQLGQDEQTILKLLEFEVGDNSCSFFGPVSMDIPLLPLARVPSPCSISGQWPFVCIRAPALSLVWDMRTRIFHKLPSFSSGLPRITAVPMPQLILSKTHIIAFYQSWCFTTQVSPVNIILQAFVVPDPLPHSDSEGIRELRLTHEASMVEMSYSMCLLRNSVFDPVTKATNLRILHHFPSFGVPVPKVHMRRPHTI
ncbi:hypothetical protein BU15DRAFT_76238 [Melanogaster broomeanus]|nr:hypothetical protein BU15DRAFT_76238 [Melanogaster broomeanus]